ncbi:unnamed protein product [Protopolystoma xenopodis]|uniref:Uncharacterized protein n=1 Tax=Protopolystoma xenopodis TaxID=117903 RepID=A0A448XSD1_9PLAT|nr:unnamed protein product [Protopolystoma xenopodis]
MSPALVHLPCKSGRCVTFCGLGLVDHTRHTHTPDCRCVRSGADRDGRIRLQPRAGAFRLPSPSPSASSSPSPSPSPLPLPLPSPGLFLSFGRSGRDGGWVESAIGRRVGISGQTHLSASPCPARLATLPRTLFPQPLAALYNDCSTPFVDSTRNDRTLRLEHSETPSSPKNTSLFAANFEPSNSNANKPHLPTTYTGDFMAVGRTETSQTQKVTLLPTTCRDC